MCAVGEGAVLLRERDEGLGVERHAELLAEGVGERRVQHGFAEKADLEVAAVAADGQRTQEHRAAELLVAVLPVGHADAEVHGVDAADGGELGALGLDVPGGDAGCAEGDLVADQAREQGGLAGDELREATGVGRRELDPGAGVVREVHEGAGPADA
jgi:hypothetical protein